MRAVPLSLVIVCGLAGACSPSVPPETAAEQQQAGPVATAQVEAAPADAALEQPSEAPATAAPADESPDTVAGESAAAAPADEIPESAADETAAPPPASSIIPAPDDVAAPPSNAQRSASGLAWVVLTPGTGKAHPTPQDLVRVHFAAWTQDGTMLSRSEHVAVFDLRRNVSGLIEALQLMTVGAKHRFWIPVELASGALPRHPGAPAGQLTFDIELLDIISAPKAPADVAAPSAGSKTTASGLAYKVLEPGRPDGKKLGEASHVTVFYTGWAQDGTMFRSSVMHRGPTIISVAHVIKGWTEGLQLMKEGATYRFWIPAELAYGETPRHPGAPSGQVTFDIQLISVH